MLMTILFMMTMGFGALLLWEGIYILGFVVIILGITMSRAYNAEIYAENAQKEAEELRKELIALHIYVRASVEALGRGIEDIEREVRK